MNTANVSRVILPLMIIAFALHRGYYVRKHGPEENTLKKREGGLISRVSGILGLVGIMAIIVYVVNPGSLAWSSLAFPSGCAGQESAWL